MSIGPASGALQLLSQLASIPSAFEAGLTSRTALIALDDTIDLWRHDDAFAAPLNPLHEIMARHRATEEEASPEETLRALDRTLADLKPSLLEDVTCLRWIAHIQEKSATLLRGVSPLPEASSVQVASAMEVYASEPYASLTEEQRLAAMKAAQEILPLSMGIFRFTGTRSFQTVFVNSYNGRVSGHPSKRIVGLDGRVFFTPGSVGKFEDAVEEAHRNGTSVLKEAYMVRRGQNPAFVDVCFGRVPGTADLGWFAIQDQTDFWKATKQILNFRTILIEAGQPLGVYELDTADGAVSMLHNKAFARLLGYEPDEIRGMAVPDFIHPEQLGELSTRLVEFQKSGSLDWPEIRMRQKDGTYRLVDMVANVSTVGKKTFGLAIYSDSQARIAAEEEQIAAQSAETTRMAAAGIAHDLNNHLTVVFGMIQLLQMSLPKDDKESQTQLAEMMEYAELMNQMVIDFREAAGGKDQGAMTPVDLNLLLTERKIRYILKKDVELDLQLDEESWDVLGSRHRLWQMVVNLLKNAREAMEGRDGKRLAVRTEKVMITNGNRIVPGQYMKLSVTDNGRGMSEETRAKIFEAFASTKDGGRVARGLGLDSTRRIVERHRGLIAVESVLGEGTTFAVYLPKLGDNPAAVSATMGIDKGEWTSGGRDVVLVVDDEEHIREQIGRILRFYEYKTVFFASNAEEALALAEREPITVLVTDRQLPGFSGDDLIAEIRKKRPGLPVLMASGDLDRDARAENGMSYLAKPFNREGFITTLTKLIRGR